MHGTVPWGAQCFGGDIVAGEFFGEDIDTESGIADMMIVMLAPGKCGCSCLMDRAGLGP